MTIDRTVELQIQSIYRKLQEENSKVRNILIYEREGSVNFDLYYDMLVDTYKSEEEKQKLTFPKSALESLVMEALVSGRSKSTVKGHLEYLHDKADDFIDNYEIVNEYKGEATITLNLEIIEGQSKFSYETKH